jgi:hypothetical protein
MDKNREFTSQRPKPTVSIESLSLSCLIDAMENQDVGTCDIPVAFMQVEIDEEIHIKFEGELTDLLISVDESYSTLERGKKVIYINEQGTVWNSSVVLDETVSCRQTQF